METLIKSNHIRCFPNPCSGSLELSGLPKKNLKLFMFNIIGLKEFTRVINGFNSDVKVDLNVLPPGIYMLLIFDENELLYSEKIIML